ncbi:MULTISPECIES: sugar kinase [unclassified Streptomyces]|uniref:sugar kinase n=1 Tax=unclassified Streptomyces TaxID=2593676 RepID=UPI00332E07E0
MDVVALGESMATFVPTRPGPLADVPAFSRAVGGAESNVACAMAALGHAARWVSRVGADGFGQCVVAGVAEYGVDVSAVRRDPSRPTGVYFRTAADRDSGAHEVAYYRAGSAASAMSPDNTDHTAVLAGRVLHLSGITAALSAECRALMRDLTSPRPARPLVSFDVNYRPALWRHDTDGPRVLLELARRADIVFVGEDEAAQVWGVTGGPGAIRRMLPEPGVLVVKQGARGATAFRRRAGSRTGPRPAPAPGTFEPTRTTDAAGTFEPSPAVTAVSAIGAGDSFAAGYLSATLRALPLRRCLRYGHLLAAATLTAATDLAPPPARAHADRLAALDDAAWGRLRLAPGWTQTARAPEEANTP